MGMLSQTTIIYYSGTSGVNYIHKVDKVTGADLAVSEYAPSAGIWYALGGAGQRLYACPDDKGSLDNETFIVINGPVPDTPNQQRGMGGTKNGPLLMLDLNNGVYPVGHSSFRNSDCSRSGFKPTRCGWDRQRNRYRPSLLSSCFLNALYEVNETTMAIINGPVTGPGTGLYGAGGAGEDLFVTDYLQGKFYKMDKSTLVDISSGGFSTTQQQPADIGGLK